MKYDELRELLQYDDVNRHESLVFMPNEIFDDLQTNISSSPHVAFSYSYIYLVTWLYRYAVYGRAKETLTTEHIKRILTYGARTQEINYLIKKNGVLEKLDYVRTTRDFPTSYHYKNDYDHEMYLKDLSPRLLTFTTLEDWKGRDFYDYLQNGKNYKIKYPLRAFNRYPQDDEMKEDYEKGYEDGTFFEFHNTHLIPFDVFLYCMSNKKIGCTGFYLYAYLKFKNDKHKEGYDVSIESLVEDTGIPNSTLNDYLRMLKSYRMIQFQHNQELFSLALKIEDRKANTYITNDYFAFSDKPVPYDKIKIVPKYEYLKQLKEEEESKRMIWGSQKVDIALEDLPY